MKDHTINTETQAVIDAYNALRVKPWGESTIVEGFYHIGVIEELENSVANKKQAIGYTYWKRNLEDAFDTNVIFPIPLAPLYNKHSNGSNISLENLLGQVICINSLDHYLKDNKKVYVINWRLLDEMGFLPSDIELDFF